MFYKIEECNNLKKSFEEENNFKYDLVLRMRSDLIIYKPLPLDVELNSNTLYLPIYGNYAGACDQIGFGSSEVMDKYSSLFSNIEKHLMDGAYLSPEFILKFHLNKNNIIIKNKNIDFVIKRENGSIQNNMILERKLGFVK